MDWKDHRLFADKSCRHVLKYYFCLLFIRYIFYNVLLTNLYENYLKICILDYYIIYGEYW
jgi:hypothetical protein